MKGKGFENRHARASSDSSVEMHDGSCAQFELFGSLDAVGKIIGIDRSKQKLARGKALVKKFCTPTNTKKEPWDRCTHLTNPEEWEEFVEYCHIGRGGREGHP